MKHSKKFLVISRVRFNKYESYFYTWLKAAMTDYKKIKDNFDFCSIYNTFENEPIPNKKVIQRNIDQVRITMKEYTHLIICGRIPKNYLDRGDILDNHVVLFLPDLTNKSLSDKEHAKAILTLTLLNKIVKP